jgi:hypothetical protein
MNYIPLGGEKGKGKWLLVNAEDFARLAQYNWCLDAHGYACARICGKVVKAHRFILGLSKGDPSVDHRDGNPLNCQRSNLRLSTQQQNMHNKRQRSDSSSPYTGVEVRSHSLVRPYRAYIRHDARLVRIGSFSNSEDAARAYDRKAIELFGEFAKTNFPVTDYV